MSTKFFALLTNIGAARLANATAMGSQLDITHMAVGDGGGTLPTPDPAQTRLVNEKRRAAINTLSVDANNANQIIAEQVIPENEGGFWIREIGLFDAEGNLIAVANCAETYKPQLQEGSGRIQTVRMILIVSSTETVSPKIDPAVVLTTRGYVDSAVIEVKAYADNVMEAHLAAADPHTQYAPKASPALTAVQTTNNTQIATTAFVKAALSALVASSPAALDTLSELAAALGNDPNFATTMTNALAAKAPLASPVLTGTPTAPTAAATVNNTQIATTAHVKATIAAGKLATARKINGVAFDGTADINLTPGSLGLVEIVETGSGTGYYWRKFADGKIEIFARASLTLGAPLDIVFPKVFTGLPLIFIQENGGADVNGWVIRVRNLSKTGFSVAWNTWSPSGSGSAIDVCYHAFGS
ncbi:MULTISPECIES: phage tail protein [Symbiopectobacterium]|uniref:phage tail protein n=1 Tax=Symbiopectobacterium TaxID=801 RepID=UPI001A258AD8|nr:MULTISPECIES: phage tail protein [Symbiopectobacterium]MBG6247346.1 phage tail protein [Candidatus Symbiopectobacterium sp. PLON1]MBT9429518.1 phage tail protein [Candidatus Symbiopectobacterium endolongispinus]